jgi:hypothetical protein
MNKEKKQEAMKYLLEYLEDARDPMGTSPYIYVEGYSVAILANICGLITDSSLERFRRVMVEAGTAAANWHQGEQFYPNWYKGKTLRQIEEIENKS